MLISTLEAENANPGLEDYIELKTTRNSERHALSRWYMRPYLLGVPVLTVGYRRSKSHVSHVEESRNPTMLSVWGGPTPSHINLHF